MSVVGGTTLSLAIGGLSLRKGGVGGPVDAAEFVQLLGAAAASGYAAVQLDGTARGVRARELGRSARRDIAALLRRSDVACSGVDLWIPPEHFTQPDNVDRALAAVLGAIELVGELSSLATGMGGAGAVAGGAGRVVGVVLPETLDDDILGAMLDSADRGGVRLADHAWPIVVNGGKRRGGMGVGLDPAVLLAAGGDPAREVSALAGRLACARLSDWSATPGAGRVGPGDSTGRLDVMGYRVAIETGGYAGPVVVDVRGIADQAAAMRRAINVWADVPGPMQGPMRTKRPGA